MATTVQGAAHPLAKLTDPDVRRMREAHAAGETISALSREFNVSRTQVRKIVEGRAWRHVGEPVKESVMDFSVFEPRTAESGWDRMAIGVRRAFASGFSVEQIAKHLLMKREAVQDIVDGRD